MSGCTPSITQPMAEPWLSHQVVKRNACPREFPAMAALFLRLEAFKQLAFLGRRFHLHHPDGMIAGILMMDLSGHSSRHIGEKIEGCSSHLLQSNVSAQGRVILVPPEDIAEIANPGSCQRLDGPGGDGVHTNALGDRKSGV